MERVTDRATVRRWLAGYEAAWRAPGTEGLADLFTVDASYLQSPYEQPVTGLDAIKRMWEAERAGPDEVFTLASDIIAVDGPMAVVRAQVRYGEPPRQEYRDLWVIRLAGDGRCAWFEEWPYWPGRPYSAHDDPRDMSRAAPEVKPVAWVESPLKHKAQAPRQGSEGAPSAWLAVEPDFAEATRDLRPGERVIVLTWLDRARRDELSTVPGDTPASRPLGVFSTRSPDRPNPVGLHRVQILAVEGPRIQVSELEALDGTPVIDIKPVIDPVAER